MSKVEQADPGGFVEYGYQHFKRELPFEDMAWRGGPSPGEQMPDFDLPTA